MIKSPTCAATISPPSHRRTRSEACHSFYGDAFVNRRTRAGPSNQASLCTLIVVSFLTSLAIQLTERLRTKHLNAVTTSAFLISFIVGYPIKLQIKKKLR